MSSVLQLKLNIEDDGLKLGSGNKVYLVASLESFHCLPASLVINLMALMFELWRGNGNCREGDKSQDIWDWDVLKEGVWKTRGRAVLNWRLITGPMGHWLLLISELSIRPIS